jgi:hypothetical protein
MRYHSVFNIHVAFNEGETSGVPALGGYRTLSGKSATGIVESSFFGPGQGAKGALISCVCKLER